MDRLTTPAIATPAIPREAPLLMPAQSLLRYICVSAPERDPTPKGRQYTEIEHQFSLILGTQSAPIKTFHPYSIFDLTSNR
jgi:hypothetical protein